MLRNNDRSALRPDARKRLRSASVRLVRAAVFAALYVGLCFAFSWCSYGLLQVRVAEAMSLLPMLFPEAIAGLAIGCLLANIASIPLDIGLGTLATLAAAVCAYLIGRFVRSKPWKTVLGGLPAVVFNAALVPIVLITAGWNEGYAYWTLFGIVAAGQSIAVFALGIPLYLALDVRFGPKKQKPVPPRSNADSDVLDEEISGGSQ